MVSDAPRVLVCLVEGESVTFKVEAAGSMRIMELKVLIRKEGINALHAVDAKDLTIWKVDLAPPPEDEWKYLTGRDVPRSSKLRGFEKISDHWPKARSPNPKHIHVIVECPSASVLGKRSCAADDPQFTDLAWLREVHSKIWNKKGRRSELFREITVTQADYAELQEHLKVQHPNRDSPDYRSDEFVLSVKLKFLLSLTPEALSSDDDDDLETSNEDDVVLKSLFPSRLRFLDLSTLGLEAEVTDRFPLPLLLRQEYEDISELIKNERQSSRGSVMVSGQPGMGKTAYLFLRIIENMIEGRPFLYQDIGRIVYHVAKEGVEVIRSWSSNEAITAFVDGDERGFEPRQILRRSTVQLIVASSPKGTFRKWTSQMGQGSFITEIAVKLWSQKELLLTGIFLHPFDLPFKLLRESTLYFGYNPRRCFEASSSIARLDLKRKEVASAIRYAASVTDNIFHLVSGIQTGDLDVPRAIFQIFPKNTDPKQLFALCQVEPVSIWALDVLLRQYEVGRTHAIAEFYRTISTMPEAASLRGHMFKRLVLKHLPDNCTECSISIRRLTDSNKMTWTYHEPVRRIDFQGSTFFNETTKAVRDREKLHLVPLICDFPVVDSIFYDPNDSNAVLTCIQITIDEDHDIVVSGLQRIQSWLKHDTRLEDLHPSEDRPWRFVFAVPSSMADKFKLQKLVGDTSSGNWAGKVDQYVLGLDEQTILRGSRY